MKRDIGYIGAEIELVILNEEGYVVDGFRKIAANLPKKEKGLKHKMLEKSRIIHDIWESQPEVNVKPFWEMEFNKFHRELIRLLVDLWEAGIEAGYYVCLLPTPPKGHIDPILNTFFPRDAETQALHYHYSKNGGFPDRRSRIPYYNAFVLTYPILTVATLTSFYFKGKMRKYLGARFHIATALHPPPYIDPKAEINHEYMLKEIEYMKRVIGCVHPVPENVRLFDISFLTKEEAYWLIPRKSTVELRSFDTVPSLLIIEALWLIIAAIGKKVIKNESKFYKLDREAFMAIWKLRERVIKQGFRAKIPKVDPEFLPKINNEPWPKYLYDPEINTVKDAFLWLMEDLKEEFEDMGYTRGLPRKVISRFTDFIKEGKTPSERIMSKMKNIEDLTKILLEACKKAISDPLYIP